MDKNDRSTLALSEILILLASALNLDLSSVDRTTSSNDLEEWDSLGTINIITTLESNLGLKLDILEIPLLISVPSIIELLVSKGYQINFDK